MRVLGYVIVAVIILACARELACDCADTDGHCNESVACSLCLHSVAVTQPASAIRPDQPVIYTVAVTMNLPGSLHRPPTTPPPQA